MRLVQCLTVVRVCTTSHLFTTTKFHLYEPIRIGKRLPRHPDNISLAQPQNLFSLIERRDSSGRNDRRRKPGVVHSLFDCRNKRNTSSKRSSCVRKHCRHAFISALTRVRINSL